MTPPRVLHIFGRMDRGGAELRTLEVMRLLSPERVHMDFVALSGQVGELDDTIRAHGGTVHHLPLTLRFPWAFWRLLRRTRPDVVHSHVHMASGPILVLAAMARVPARIAHFRTISDGAVSSRRRRLYRRTARLCVRLAATDILAVSAGVLSAAWDASWAADARCGVIASGVDLAALPIERSRSALLGELQLPHDARVLAHVGNFTRPKNHARLLRIFARMSARDPRWVLVLAGRGGTPEHAHVVDRVRRDGLAARVRLLGLRSDVARVLGAADLMVFPSLREGLPGAVLEAVAVGVPVLASELPGTSDIARSTPWVWCRSLGDDDDAWASAAQALASDPDDLSQRWRIRASLEGGPFDLHASSDRLEELWSRRVRPAAHDVPRPSDDVDR